MIKVKRKEGFILRVTRVLREPTRDSLDLYLYVPDELGLNTNVIAEDVFYHSAIHSRRTYFSTEHQLPLVRSRLEGRGHLDPERYRLSMSLYAFQFVTAQEQTTRDIIERFRDEGSENDASPQELLDHIGLIESILRRVRRNQPTEDRLIKYFANIDNYISWFTQQEMLAISAELPDLPSYREVRQQIFALCEREENYRAAQQYNSERATASPTRMSNKMRLLRRLIEFPVTLKDKPKELGGGEQRAVKALVTGLVMMVISALVLKLHVVFSDVTIWFLLALAVLYAMREVFKDDLRKTLWQWLRKGRPKWRRRYRDPERGTVVGSQREWFDLKKSSRMPDEIRRARRSNVSQRSETVLHYRSRAQMLPTRFLSGYHQTRETLTLDLELLTSLMQQGSHRIFLLEDGEVSSRKVEKRYQFNLIARSQQGDHAPDIQRWKIVLNRSRILDIEEIPTLNDEAPRAGKEAPKANELAEYP
ncbi:hypothetical protein R84981_000136 [Carnimonas sp. R-84981]|uniref:hypothetical protein n=1 Tax=Carnimonas bestiolae TaxID=3402172 RepID=UPI003EDB88B9